jgi:hypothetical protein
MKHRQADAKGGARLRIGVVAVRAVIAGGALACAAGGAQAAITKLVVTRTESPTFGGASFPGVGQYEKITARAYGEVDPAAPGNALITDINGAPRNANGHVAYSMDVVIIKPLDPSKGSGKIFYDVVNRGNKGSYTTFNQAPTPSANTNSDASFVGTGLLMRRGYTIVWSGWEDNKVLGTDPAVVNPNTLSAQLPIAKNPDGSPIVQHMIVEQIFDNANVATSNTFALPFAANSMNPSDVVTSDTARSYMVVHNHTAFTGGPHQSRVPVPTSVWSFVNGTTVRINRTDPFLTAPADGSPPYDFGAAFEFVFPAQDPIVEGLGFAATRDLISFLKNDASTQNPVAGAIKYAISRGDSESGRYLKGFLYWGFNQDESGKVVFDGMSPHISGAHAIAANDRFGDANATGRSYQRHLSAKMEFPFTYGVRADPFTGAVDGIMKRCLATGTCPRIAHTDSGNEPYLKPVSLVTTDGPGNGALPADIALPDNVRVYTIGSTQHAPGGSVFSTTAPSPCQQPQNPNQWAPYVRDLGIMLDDWVTQGIAPPGSRYARMDDGTLVSTLNNFPAIPGVTYTGWYNPVDELDKSVLPNMPIPGESYTILVPKNDADGNYGPGVRTLDVQVPVATYTGWGTRRANFATNEDCALTGQVIPFKTTKAQQQSSGDPRKSVEERYPSFSVYDAQLIAAVNATVANRLLLCEDGNSELARLRALGVQAQVPGAPATFTPYSVPLAQLSGVSASQPSVWPPTGDMVSESINVDAPYTCNLQCSVVSVSGNDGATPADYQITGPLAVALRATRKGNGNGRSYSVNVQCTDPQTSMSTVKTAVVTVPHDQGK